MGKVSLPQGGQVHVDTQTLIYSVEHHPRFSPILEPMWQAFHLGQLELVTSDLTLLEALVHPLRHNDKALVADYEDVLFNAGLQLVPIAHPILREAAQLRATIPSLRTPDSMHAATARITSCTSFISNDTGFRSVPNLPLVLLSDL